MRLAFRELWRRPGRFVTATGILTLISLLLLFLGGLLDGLLNNSTGAVRAQPGDVIVYSSTARESFLRSRIDPAVRERVEALPVVDEVGGLGIVQLGARLPDRGPRELLDVALFGVELAPRGVPEVPPPGQAYADEVLREQGVERGMTLLLGPARSPVTVIGFVKDTNYLGQGGLWAAPETWREVLTANRPDEILAPGVFQTLVVRGQGPVDELAAAIDAATAGATTTLSVRDAAEAIPGVREQRGTFNQIIGVTVFIAVVVVALFFALLTVERTGLYGVLKAMGASSGTLFAGVVAQAATVTLLAAAIGTAVSVGVGLAIPPGTVPFELTPTRIATSVAYLLVAAVVGCVFSLRRVLRIDPASAIGGSA